jgi:multiple sugar transport system ATP-binding protein
MSMSKLELAHIGKIYDGGVRAVDDFNLSVKDGEFIVLVGPSGCGKSTMLRMIAGLESITEGTFSIDGKVVNNLPPVDRDISLVFQNYALYGTMSIYDNVGMSLKVRHRPKVEIYDHVMETSKFLGIEEFLNRFPSQLSGGQKQRVALGRSIARNPKLFLMDEPLSNLDAKLRAFTRGEIVRIQRDLGITTLYVTHDQVEAMTMADRIVIMKGGILQQVGTPSELYNFPCNEFVAGFIGMPPMNIISGKIERGSFVWEGYSLKLNDELYERVKNYEGKKIRLGFRAENISIGDGENCLKAKVRFKEYLGGSYSLFLMLGEDEVTATVDDKIDVDKEFLNITIDQSKIHFFDAETTERIN